MAITSDCPRDETQRWAQWFVLRSLQECSTMTLYQLRRAELYEFARRFPRRKVGYYLAFLLEETRKDKQSGAVYFTDKVCCKHLAPPPKQRPALRLIINHNYKPENDPLEDFKI